jgi:hypothetical protein
LFGRSVECGVLDQILAQARAGRSQALVVRGEAGIGKSALLDYLSRGGGGFRIAKAVGAEAEAELAFAGLHQLCGPMLHHLDRLPVPQQVALATAFGLTAGAPPDRFLVGLAVLSLLAVVAEGEPLLCLVDDAQWMDATSVQILAFVARRLLAERIAMVFAGRPVEEDNGLVGLPELAVRGLGDADSRAVLQQVLRAPVDPAVLDEIVAECRGNPLALVELPRAWPMPDLAGGFASPDTVSLPLRMEQGFLKRLESLPGTTRSLVLLAAAEPLGDSVLLWHAARSLGLPADAAGQAEAAGLVEFGARIRFRHPLVRSTVYRAAEPDERRRAHRALAQASDPDRDPDRHAWHRAQGTVGTDETVAADLERSAERAQARGGLAAAAVLPRTRCWVDAGSIAPSRSCAGRCAGQTTSRCSRRRGRAARHRSDRAA